MVHSLQFLFEREQQFGQPERLDLARPSRSQPFVAPPLQFAFG
jgi:hypothetical protein